MLQGLPINPCYNLTKAGQPGFSALDPVSNQVDT